MYVTATLLFLFFPGSKKVTSTCWQMQENLNDVTPNQHCQILVLWDPNPPKNENVIAVWKKGRNRKKLYHFHQNKTWTGPQNTTKKQHKSSISFMWFTTLSVGHCSSLELVYNNVINNVINTLQLHWHGALSS